jgi:hypothetical protein
VGNRVTTIGPDAFYGCATLQAINVDALNPYYSSLDGVLFNGNQTWLIQYPWGKAGPYTIPNGTIDIGRAFSGCTSLTDLTIPDSLTTIGDYAFLGCTGLNNITFGNGLAHIGNSAFSQCSGLTSVILPHSLTDIGNSAFSSCAKLTSITIGPGVTNLGASTFAMCSSLAAVFFSGDAPSRGDEYVFWQDSIATVYYLPGTAGWIQWTSPPPAVLWNPQPESAAVLPGGFGFSITGTPNIPIAVAACTNPANPTWLPLQTCTLTNGSIYFTDPDWTNHPTRFYRIRSP